MVTAVRQRATRELRGRRGRKKDPEWASRRRLLTGHERLSPVAFARLWNGLVDAGDLGVEILHAYAVKETLRDLLALAPTPGTSVPDRSAISHRLWRFLDLAAATDSPEVHRLAATIEAWWPAIEAGLVTGHSNARSEGYNRLAKHQGRNAFGFRNPRTNAGAYAGPALVNTGEPQPRTARCPVKFDEPVKDVVLQQTEKRFHRCIVTCSTNSEEYREGPQ
jgi:transposase